MKRDLGISKIKMEFILLVEAMAKFWGCLEIRKKLTKRTGHHVNKYAKENNFKINSYKKVCEELKGVYKEV